MKDLAEMTQEETQLLCEELLRRAAQGFEQSGSWRDAAACWVDLGELQQAGALYQRGGDLEQAARTWLEAHHYAEALALYQQWEGQLIEENRVLGVRALLGQAACHHLGIASHMSLSTQPPVFSLVAGQQAYQQARILLATITAADNPFSITQAWTALGDYGVLLNRYDLVQEGYEQALDGLEKLKQREEFTHICNAYLVEARAKSDWLLCQALEERLGKWETVEEKPKRPAIQPFPVEKLRLLHTIAAHTSDIYGLISPNGQTFISGSTDRTIKIWNLLAGMEERTLASNTHPIWSLALSSDEQTLVSGSSDNTIKVWNLLTGSEIRTLTGHTGGVPSLVISPNGQLLVSGSHDCKIKEWNLLTGAEIRTLTGHTKLIPTQSLALSSDGQFLYSGSRDCTIKEWNLLTGSEIRIFNHGSDIFRIAISPDGQTLVSGSENRTIKVWNLLTGSEIRTLTGHTDSIVSLAISPDGQTLVSGSEDGMIKLWNLLTGSEIRTLTGHTGHIWALAITPDGQTLVSGGRDGIIKIWGV